MISSEQFRKVFPTLSASKRAEYLPLLIAAMREFGITTRARVCAFLAQVGHESGDFKWMQEIASGEAYEGRVDLGNTQAGDGKRFKGRGPLGTTGRDNYEKAGLALDLPLLDAPELLEIPANGFRASGFFWLSNGCNALADKLTGTGDGVDLSRFDAITRKVNGSYNGRADRRVRYLRALANIRIIAVSGDDPTDHITPYLDQIPVNDDTIALGKTVGSKVVKKAGFAAARPVAIGWAALQAGSVKWILGVAVGGIGCALLLYWHRRDIARVGAWAWGKVCERYGAKDLGSGNGASIVDNYQSFDLGGGHVVYYDASSLNDQKLEDGAQGRGDRATGDADRAGGASGEGSGARADGDKAS